MPVYIRVKVEAMVKVQDPCDVEDVIAELEETTYIHCPFELVEERYYYSVEDTD